MRGSVREKEPGRWELRVSLGRDPQTNRRVTRSKMVDAKDEPAARRKLDRWIVEIGSETVADRVTMGRLFEAWYQHTAPGRQDRSNDTVRDNLDHHLIPHMGRWPLATVDVAKLETAYSRLREEKGLSDGTMRHLHYIVRPSMRLAQRWGWRDDNPAELVDLGRLRRRKVHPPTDDDVIRLLEACDTELLCFLRIAAITGARRSEIGALRWGDLDWLAGTLSIQGAVTQPKGQEVKLKATKTDESTRRVSVDFDTLAALEAQRARNVSYGAGDGPARFIFPDLRRDAVGALPYRPGIWSGRFTRLKRQLDLDHVRLHDLRHYVATSLLESGAPTPAVSKLLGHARQSTTTDLYGEWAGDASDPRLANALAARLQRDDPPPGPRLST